MRKILFGIMGIVMTGAVVAASAYALFTASATVNGINFSTGGAAITLSKDNAVFTNTLDAGLNIVNAFPGYGVDNSKFAPLWVKNEGTGVNIATISAQLTAATGWGNGLENNVEVAVKVAGQTPVDGDYQTLATWNANPISLPLPAPLTPGSVQAYDVFVRLPNSAPNSVANKSLTNITFVLTGSQ